MEKATDRVQPRSRTLRHARTAAADPVDIHIADGVITGVDPAEPTKSLQDSNPEIDIAGRVVIPGLVDAHVHLDKAYLMPELEARGAFQGGGLGDAMRVTKQLRAELPLAAVIPGMRRVLQQMRRTGTVAARAHVEIDRDVDPAIVSVHREVARDFADIRVQLSAFPQNGLTHDRAVMGRMERALDDGCTVVGGCPYADADPASHLELVAALARDRGLPLDLHLDLTDDPDASQLELVLPIIERAGLAGRVTLGHMTVLSAWPPARVREIGRRLCGLGISVVAIPTTDVWLSGRTSGRPGVRGVAPVAALMSAGVSVALASNNHQNAFTPVGSGGLLRVAWLAALLCQIGDEAGQLRLLEAVTSTPAAILGLGTWGVQPGSHAPLLMLDCDTLLDAVREAPAVLARC